MSEFMGKGEVDIMNRRVTLELPLKIFDDLTKIINFTCDNCNQGMHIINFDEKLLSRALPLRGFVDHLYDFMKKDKHWEEAKRFIQEENERVYQTFGKARKSGKKGKK